MKKRILVDVDVNDDEHATIIYDEIKEILRTRTTVYRVKFDDEYKEV